MEGLEAHPVLLYDGDCRFCAEQAERLRRWAGGGVELESFRAPGVLARHPQVSAAACEEAMQLVLPDGRVLAGAAAVAHLLGLPHLPRGHLRRARAPVRGRAHVRTLFLRSLGLVFVAAFLSLAAQVRLLFGARGLLPACPYVARTPWWVAPSLLRFDCSDRALLAAALAGATAALGLVLDILPAGSLVLCWLLYFSFVAIGQDFLAFQWDNLLLEAAFFALFFAPLGLRALDAPEPHPLGVFLVQWLVLRLYMESGLAKLLLGDPTWRDLTALVSYYETAPLPTWIGWWAHQMPVWAHRLCALYTYLAELLLPLAMWASRRLRAPAFLGIAGMQAAIILTANYGFFNWLALALTLFLLADGPLPELASRRPPPRRRAGRAPPSSPPQRRSWCRSRWCRFCPSCPGALRSPAASARCPQRLPCSARSTPTTSSPR